MASERAKAYRKTYSQIGGICNDEVLNPDGQHWIIPGLPYPIWTNLLLTNSPGDTLALFTNLVLNKVSHQQCAVSSRICSRSYFIIPTEFRLLII